MAETDFLVSAKELRDYMSSINLTPAQEESARQAIKAAQGDLERYCNRKFRTTSYTESRWTNAEGLLYLSNTPLVSIVSITAPPDATPLQPHYLEGWRYWPGYVDIGSPDTYVTITYTAGKVLQDEAQLESIRTKIMEVAARTVTSNHDDTLSLKGGLERDTEPPRPIKGWDISELQLFDRLRRRVVV